MLVLGRAPGEAIVIETPAGPVRVEVLEVHRGQVRLGIEADRAIEILRSEIVDRYTLAEEVPPCS